MSIIYYSFLAKCSSIPFLVAVAACGFRRTDPESGDIVNTLDGAESWGDTVYMRDLAEVHHYVFANDNSQSVSHPEIYILF